MAILNSRERDIYKKQFQKLVLEYEGKENNLIESCLLYTSDAADD